MTMILTKVLEYWLQDISNLLPDPKYLRFVTPYIFTRF